MSNLRNVISQLADKFAAGVLEAIRGASLEDILLESRSGGLVASPAPRGKRPASPRAAAPPAAPVSRKRPSGRLERRSAGDIAGFIGEIVGLLEKHPKGLRAEEIRAKLGVEAKELPRPLLQAHGEGRIRKVGEKRATTYFAGTGTGNAKGSEPKGARSEARSEDGASAKSSKGDGKAKGAKAKAKSAAAPKNGRGKSVAAAPSKSTPPASAGAASAPPAGANNANKKRKSEKKGEKGDKASSKGSSKGNATKSVPIEEAATVVTGGTLSDEAV